MPKATKRERQHQNRDARRAEMLAAQKRHKQRRTTRNLAFLLLPVVLIFVALQVFSGSNDSSSASITRSYSKPPTKIVKDGVDYTATIDTSEGAIQLSLDTANALKVANNFVFLAKHKFYNGLRFVRVAKDFVIQAGSPKNTTSGGPGYSDVGLPPTTVAGQPAYPVGTVAMAKTPSEPAATFGSQFFIVTGSSNADLLPDYAIIGRVSSGLDVAQKIGLLYPKSGDGKPTKTVTIRKITINSQPAATTATTAAPATTAPATTAAP
ncbi:MAG TPA: peptidylprolyl isomerase [Acidimicrobiia bacterium]